jgi:recombination protein RecT
MADNNNQSNGNEKALTPYMQLKQLALEDKATIKRFADALGGNERRARVFLSNVLTVVSGSSSLQQCNPNAILNECMKSAVMDLPINEALGFACIVPYKGVPKFLPMKNGYLQLAHRTHQYDKLNTDSVHANQKVIKNPKTGDVDIDGEPDRSLPITHYFNYFHKKDGFEHTLCWTVEECLAWGKRYNEKAFLNPSGLWQTNPDAMCKAKVTKLNLKWYGELNISGDDDEEDEYLDPALMNTDANGLPFDETPSEAPQGNTPNVEDAEFTMNQPETVTPAPAFVEDQTPPPAAEPEKTKAKKQDKAHDDSDLLIIELAKEGIAPDELAAADVVKKLKLASSLPIEEAKKIVRGWYGWKDWGASDDQAVRYLNEGKYP